MIKKGADENDSQFDILSFCSLRSPYNNKANLDPTLGRLFLSVLQSAIFDLTLAPTHRFGIAARDWILCDYPDTPFSFSWICLALGFDPKIIRHRLLTASNEELHSWSIKMDFNRGLSLFPEIDRYKIP